MEAKIRQLSGTENDLKQIRQYLASKEREIEVYQQKISILDHDFTAEQIQYQNKVESVDANYQSFKEQLHAINQEIEDNKDKLREAEEQIILMRTSPETYCPNEEIGALQKELQKAKAKCKLMKEEKKTQTAEIAALKLKAAKLESNLDATERIIQSLRRERGEMVEQLGNAECFIAKYKERMKRTEKEQELIKEHISALNANQDEMQVLQSENAALKKRMDSLEDDLLCYTQRKRKIMSKKRKIGLY